MAARMSMPSVDTAVLIQKRRLRSICLIACSRASFPVLAGVSRVSVCGLLVGGLHLRLHPSHWEPCTLIGSSLVFRY